MRVRTGHAWDLARGSAEADRDRGPGVSRLRPDEYRACSRVPGASGVRTGRAQCPRFGFGLCGDVLGKKVDLAARVLAGEASTLDTFVHDIGTIVGMELAQIRLLQEFFDVPVPQARLSFGHSIGELSALVVGGMYTMEQLLPIPLALATDCAELTANTTMGILSIQGGPPLQIEDVQHLCSTISSRGEGLIGPSTYLSPYQVLLLGQGNTLDLLEARDARVSARRSHPAAQAEPLAALAHAPGLGAQHPQPHRA